MDRSLESYMAELRNVLANSEALNRDEILNEFTIAYAAANLANEESNTEAAKEIKEILAKLNTLAKEKEETEKKYPPVKEKEENNVSVPEENVIEKIEEPKVEKEIPKPDFSEPAKLEDIVLEEEKIEEPKVEVKSAVSSTEPSKEEIVAETAIKNEDNIKQAEKVEQEVIEEPKVEKEIPKPKFEDNKIKPQQKPIETAKEKISIDEPSNNNENIIVSGEEDKKEIAKTPAEKEQEQFTNDIMDIFTPKPFDGDDDLDAEEASKDSDTDDKKGVEEKPSIVTEDENEKARLEAVEKEYSTLPDDMTMMGVKSVSRKKISDTLKELSKLDTSGIDIHKLKMFDFDSADLTLRKEYLKTRNDLVAAPRESKISLLMSGHYEIISAYGNYDLISVERNIYSNDSFVDRERLLYESIYSHVNYVSYAKEKPDFETWAKNIAYPDISSLYFGVYDANSIGDNHYLFDCPYCGREVSVSRANKDLMVAVPKELTKDKLEKFINNKEIMSLDSTDIAKWAKTTVVRKILPETSIIVDYAVPTLYDYLVTISTLDVINKRDMNGKLNLGIIDEFNDSEDDVEDFNRIMTYLYIKDIGVPARVGDSNKFRYIKLSEKADIIEHINGLSADGDYAELLRGDEVRNLIIKNATRYYLENCKCNECKRNIKYVSINPKQIFFFKIGEGREKRMTI